MSLGIRHINISGLGATLAVCLSLSLSLCWGFLTLVLSFFSFYFLLLSPFFSPFPIPPLGYIVVFPAKLLLTRFSRLPPPSTLSTLFSLLSLLSRFFLSILFTPSDCFGIVLVSCLLYFPYSLSVSSYSPIFSYCSILFSFPFSCSKLLLPSSPLCALNCS